MKNKFKTVLFGVLFLGVTITTNAQISTSTGGAANVLPNVPTTNTNVGIGTTNPSAKLEVIGEVKATQGFFTNSMPNGSVFASADDRNLKSLVLSAGSLLPGSSIHRLLRFYDFPQSNIDQKPVLYFSIEDRVDMRRFLMTAETGGFTEMSVWNKSQEELMKLYEDGSNNVYMQFGKPNSRVVIGGFSDNPNSLGHKLFVQGGSAKIEGNILTDSNIGIGTSNFVDGTNTYRLSVKGKIRAEEIKVYNTWADYVFKADYKLPNLKDVETYIKENGHLPNVPSAEEVTEKGLELGEMSKIQQEKIEELTLYIIAQNKRIEALEQKINNK